MQTCTLAVDIGASSGRHIVGTVQDGRIVLQEVYRFENGVRRKDGHLCWDIDTLARRSSTACAPPTMPGLPPQPSALTHGRWISFC